MTDADEGLEHAWKWFELHSQQRFTTMNFFIVIAAAFVAGSATLLKDGQELACASLGFALSGLAILFFLMDRRARRLIKIGEAALMVCEARLAGELTNPTLTLVAHADVRTRGEFTYGEMLWVMYGFFFCTGVGLAALGLLSTPAP